MVFSTCRRTVDRTRISSSPYEMVQGPGVRNAAIFKYCDAKEKLFLHTITNIIKNHLGCPEQALEHIEEAVGKLEFLCDCSLKAPKKIFGIFFAS